MIEGTEVAASAERLAEQYPRLRMEEVTPGGVYRTRPLSSSEWLNIAYVALVGELQDL